MADLSRRRILAALGLGAAIAAATPVSAAGPAGTIEQAIAALFACAKRHGMFVGVRDGQMFWECSITNDRGEGWTEALADLAPRVKRHPDWRQRVAYASIHFDWS